MSALREVLAKFGLDFDKKGMADAEKSVNKLADNLKEMAGVLLGEKLIGGIKDMVTEMTDLGDQIVDTSAQLGISTDDLQRYGLAAKLSGAEAQDLAAGLRVLEKNMADAAEGGAMAAEFKKLGVSVKDASGNTRPAIDTFKDVGLAIAALPDPAARTAAMMKLMGKGGAKLGPMFADGADGLEALLAELDKAGGGIGKDALKTIGETGDALDKWKVASNSLKAALATSLFPTLTKGIEAAIKWSKGFGEMTKGSNILKAAIIVLGAAAGKAAIGMYAKYLPMALLLAILILLVDDLITFFQGGDSAIEAFLKSLFGAKEGAQIAQDIRKDFKALADDLAKIPGLGNKIAEAFSQVGASLVKFFVADIPEAWGFFWKDVNKKNETGGTTMTDFFKSWAQGLAKSFDSWATEMGDAFIDGLVLAVKNGVKKVTDGLNSLGASAKKAWDDFWDIGSPSKVMYDSMANHIIKGGMIRGIVNMTPKVVGNVKDMAADMHMAANEPWIPRDIRIPSVSLPNGSGGTSLSATVQQVNVYTDDRSAGGILTAAKEGASRGLQEASRATLAALEPQAAVV